MPRLPLSSLIDDYHDQDDSVCDGEFLAVRRRLVAALKREGAVVYSHPVMGEMVSYRVTECEEGEPEKRYAVVMSRRLAGAERDARSVYIDADS